MRCNKKVLMIATTVMLGVGCIGLMGAMKYQNVKTEASDMKESDVAKAGIDVSSQSMEGETPIEDEDKLDKEVVETYSYKGYEVSFIRYKTQRQANMFLTRSRTVITAIKRHSGKLLTVRKKADGIICWKKLKERKVR